MKRILVCMLLIGSLNYLAAQSISVIHIQGDVKTSPVTGKMSGAKINLSYGPVSNEQTLELSNRAIVKLIKDGAYHCEISGPGTFIIKNLEFKKIEEKSSLTTFLDYFKSFFVAHPNSESKEYYSNSITAISKGKLIMPPLLSFPFPGDLPLLKRELEFSWDIRCDTCTYNLIVQDLNNKQVVLNEVISKKHFAVKNPEKVFELNKKYIWQVNVPGSDLQSLTQIFNTNSEQDYQSKITELENLFKKDNPFINPVTQTVGVFSSLEKEKLTNYIILYGQSQLKKHPKEAAILDVYNRVYYDNLKRRRI